MACLVDVSMRFKNSRKTENTTKHTFLWCNTWKVLKGYDFRPFHFCHDFRDFQPAAAAEFRILGPKRAVFWCFPFLKKYFPAAQVLNSHHNWPHSVAVVTLWSLCHWSIRTVRSGCNNRLWLGLDPFYFLATAAQLLFSLDRGATGTHYRFNCCSPRHWTSFYRYSVGGYRPAIESRPGSGPTPWVDLPSPNWPKSSSNKEQTLLLLLLQGVRWHQNVRL